MCKEADGTAVSCCMHGVPESCWPPFVLNVSRFEEIDGDTGHFDFVIQPATAERCVYTVDLISI